MKKKRILISILSLMFLVSTTGLPIFYHYCQMSGKKSFNKCEICSQEQRTKLSCCSEEIAENILKLTSEKSTCCIDQFDYRKIEDKFSQSNNSNQLHTTVVITIIDQPLLNYGNGNRNPFYKDYDLPPPRFGKQLLQIIHQLKIDLPVC